jgi:hypothetical protein
MASQGRKIMAWHLQQITNFKGPTIPGEYIATDGPESTGYLSVSVFNNQQHFTYIDLDSNIQDAWWDGNTSQWHLQQINNPSGPSLLPGEYIATNGPAAGFGSTVFVSVYCNQQHFTYIDQNGNIQDAWYDGDTNQWHLQQINNPNGPAMVGEYIATNGPAAGVQVFVSVYGNQQHFTWVDSNANIQDAWYDGNTNQWHLQQINNWNGPTIDGEYIATNGPAVEGVVFVSVYRNQQHFTYIDLNQNIQDAWYDGDTNQWHLQQLTNNGVSVPGEYVVPTPGPAPLAPPVVSVFGDQQHFAYIDPGGNIQDVWYDGAGNQWHLQQINNPNGPALPGEYIARSDAPAAAASLFVSVYNNQQHFTYIDSNGIDGNIQDVWYDGDNNQWHLQQINGYDLNALNNGATVPGEYIATNGPLPSEVIDSTYFLTLFVSVYNDQQHFVYQDINNNIQDAWWG